MFKNPQYSFLNSCEFWYSRSFIFTSGKIAFSIHQQVWCRSLLKLHHPDPLRLENCGRNIVSFSQWRSAFCRTLGLIEFSVVWGMWQEPCRPVVWESVGVLLPASYPSMSGGARMGHHWSHPCGTNDVHMLGRGGSTAVETLESAPHTSCQIILVQWALGSFGAWQCPASCGWIVSSVPGWRKCPWSWLLLLFLRAESSGTLCVVAATGCRTDWLLPSSRSGRRTPRSPSVVPSGAHLDVLRSADGHVEATKTVHKGHIVLWA